MRNKPWVWGVTGPTGAGKSCLTAWLQAQGAAVVDADRLAREAVVAGSACLEALVTRFSAAILLPDGSLNRRELARRAFASPEAQADLNAITHPPVLAMARERLTAALRDGARLAVLDAPLLFESGADTLCDYTVAVLADPDVRRRRIMQRDSLSFSQAEQRMHAQPNEAYYRQRAHAVLYNNDTPQALYEQAQRLLARLEEAPA